MALTYKVEAVETFVCRTVYSVRLEAIEGETEAQTKRRAELLAQSGQVEYVAREEVEGGSSWDRTENIVQIR